MSQKAVSVWRLEFDN